MHIFKIEVIGERDAKSELYAGMYRVVLDEDLALNIEKLEKDRAGGDRWTFSFPHPGEDLRGMLYAMVMHWLMGRPLGSIGHDPKIGHLKMRGLGTGFAYEHIFE